VSGSLCEDFDNNALIMKKMKKIFQRIKDQELKRKENLILKRKEEVKNYH
jgi:hypothetical protein